MPSSSPQGIFQISLTHKERTVIFCDISWNAVLVPCVLSVKMEEINEYSLEYIKKIKLTDYSMVYSL